MWPEPYKLDKSIGILKESKGGWRGQSISRTNWFPGSFEKLRLVWRVGDVKCKAPLMGLIPVLPSWSKCHWLYILSSSYPVAYWHRGTCIVFSCCFNQLPGVSSDAHSPTQSQFAGGVWTCFVTRGKLLYFQRCESVRRKSLFLLPLCHCQGQRNHEKAPGSQWGTLFSVTQKKSFVIAQLKSYPVKIESNISSPHAHFQRQSPCLWFHIFLVPTPAQSLTPLLFHIFSLPSPPTLV